METIDKLIIFWEDRKKELKNRLGEEFNSFSAINNDADIRYRIRIIDNKIYELKNIKRQYKMAIFCSGSLPVVLIFILFLIILFFYTK